MDGILPILIVIISVISSIAKQQKKKEAAGKTKVAPQAFVPKATKAPQPVTAAAMPKPQPVLKPQPKPQPQLMSQWAPAPAVIGPEGEDQCHEYMLDEKALREESLPVQEKGTEEETARELLRGVILSEILARPNPRAYGRRRA